MRVALWQFTCSDNGAQVQGIFGPEPTALNVAWKFDGIHDTPRYSGYQIKVLPWSLGILFLSHHSFSKKAFIAPTAYHMNICGLAVTIIKDFF